MNPKDVLQTVVARMIANGSPVVVEQPTAAVRAYVHYGFERGRRGYTVALYSTLTGDRKDIIDTELPKPAAMRMVARLNRGNA